MRTTIATEYEFSAAHWLPFVPEGHKCKREHGHNYKLVVGIAGEPDPRTGMLIDFWDLDELVKPVVTIVDHYKLNDIPGLSNPTAEVIAAWFLSRLSGALLKYDVFVRVYETPSCWAQVSTRRAT